MSRRRCERCGRRMRQVLVWPGGEWVQDWHYDYRTKRALHVADIDEDVCEDCGEEIIAACDAYRDAREAVARVNLTFRVLR